MMKTLRTILIFVIAVVVAFGAGYAVGYFQLKTIEKEWSTAKQEMQSKILALEKELVRAKTREALREIPDTLTQVMAHLTEKNFGLAAKAMEGIKESFMGIQGFLDTEMKKKLEFFLPALEELKKEADQLSLQTRKKVEDLKSLFEQALKPSSKGEDPKKG